MNPYRSIESPEIRNIFLITALALIETVQFLIIVIVIYSFIPMHVDSFVQNLFPLYQVSIKPERETTLFHLFVFAGLVLQAVLLWAFRNKLSSPDLGRKILGYLLAGIFWLGIELFASFKIVLYDNILWARCLLYAGVCLSVLTRFFWPEFQRSVEWVGANYQRYIQKKVFSYGFSVAVLALIAGIIYVPEAERIFGFIMAWGNWERFHQGHHSSIGVFNAMSDVQYVHWMTAALIGYFSLMFVFFRSWLKSSLWASGAVFLAIKWQLFHAGVSPIFWQYPQKMGLSPYIDLGLFALLLAYERSKKRPLFWLAITGLCLQGARYLWMATTGTDTVPLSSPLGDKQFFAFVWQFAVPVIYVSTLLALGMRKGQNPDHVIVRASCFLGLAFFCIHAKSSDITSFYDHSLPLVTVFVFWARSLSGRLSAGWAVIVRSFWAAVLLGALLTNNLFMIYPNFLNISTIPWEQVKQLYHQRVGL